MPSSKGIDRVWRERMAATKWYEMSRRGRFRGGLLIAAALVFLWPGPVSGQESAPIDLTLPANAAQELTEVSAQLEELKSDSTDAPEIQRKRVVLEKRAALLDESLKTEAFARQLGDIADGLADRSATAARLIAAQQDPISQTPPEEVTPEGFDSLRNEAAAQQERVAAARKLANERQLRRDRLPELVSEARERESAATRRAAQIEAAIEAGELGESERETEQIRLENARLERAIARATSEALQAERDLEKEREPVINLELDAAERALAGIEARFEAYGLRLSESVANDTQRTETELAQLEALSETAETPAERVAARWRADRLSAQRNGSEIQSWLIEMAREIAEQEKRQISEREELTTLKDFLFRAGSSAAAAERINLTLRQVKTRKQRLDQSLGRDLLDRINGFRSRRISVEDLLFNLSDLWLEDQPMLEAAPGEALPPDFLDEYREALRTERSLLTEAISAGLRLQSILVDRRDNLDETEHFIRSKAFFIRDGLPLSLKTLAPLGREFLTLAAWPRQLTSESMRARLLDTVRSPGAIVYGLALFPVLPIVLLRIRQRLRGIVRRQNEDALEAGARIRNRLSALGAGLAAASLIPIYLAFASRFFRTAGFPETVGPVLASSFAYAAWFFLFWFIGRSLFSGSAIGEVQFGMRPEVTRELHRALRFVLIAYIVFLLSWDLSRNPPFQFIAIPRLSYTLFEITAGVVLIHLCRKRSPLIQELTQRSDSGFLARYGLLISPAVVLLVAAIVVLDVTGYRYASSRLLRGFAWTLLVATLVPMVVATINGMLTAFVGARAGTPPAADDDSGESDIEARAKREGTVGRMRRVVRIIGVLAAVLFLAVLWGVNEQALQTLEDWRIYEVRTSGPENEWVTAADLTRFVLYLGVMVWLLRSLPGISEFAIFPRLKVDEGLKYAILTMSRYAIFAVGIVLALGQIHLDLSRLGWLMAAIGVGLGFGLQEIVSNFVSGIILLVERPVQVGDSVTIGTMSGKVTRINIRATTILNFDRQEVIVPNRNLITKEVTNWTRGDTINRLVISIGVVFETDVAQVTGLLETIASQDPDVLRDPAPSVIFMRHGPGSLDFDLRVFIPSPSIKMSVTDRLNKAINREFAAAGIRIAVPRHEVRLRDGGVPGKDPD